MDQGELGSIIASGRATPEQWATYWSAYAEDVERIRRQKEEEEREREPTQPMRYFPPADFPADDFDPNEIESKLEEFESRLGNLESRPSGDYGRPLAYFFGSALAMILSWSRNAGILYCIGHGILSWIYVLYFAFTR